MEMLPDKRMKKVVKRMMLGILGGQTPVISGMASQNEKTEGETWAIAKIMYRLLGNKRLDTQAIYQGLYVAGQRVVEYENPDYLVVAVDPVNFEKPYTQALEGVSVVHKAIPPDLTGHARLAQYRITYSRLILSAPGNGFLPHFSSKKWQIWLKPGDGYWAKSNLCGIAV